MGGPSAYADSWVSKLHDASWRRTDAHHGLQDLVDREATAEAEHRAALSAIRRQAELAEARRALDPPTIELPAVAAHEPDRPLERVDGPARPPGSAVGQAVPADVARMAADLRTDPDRPDGPPPSAKAVRARYGIGHDKARAVLDEFTRTQEVR